MGSVERTAIARRVVSRFTFHDPPDATVTEEPLIPQPSHPLLAGFPIVVSMPVHWGEMDAYGHVNNTVFFRYFETARIAFLDRCGLLASYDRDGIGAILHSTECRFRLPLFHPDDVLVGARTVNVSDDRFTMGYRIVSTGQNGVAADGSGIIVAYDYRGRRKVSLPPEVRMGVEGLRGGDGRAA